MEEDIKEDIYRTRTSLLAGIQRGDEIAWKEFDQTYRRFIWSIARKFHVPDADCPAVVNGVLFEIFKAKDRFRYDPQKGRFRAYLKTVVKHFVLRGRGNHPPDEPLENCPEPEDHEFEEIWRREWAEHVYQQALAILRERLEPTKFQVFSEYCLKEKDPEAVAKRFRITVGQVYLIKHRAQQMLQTYRYLLGDESIRPEEGSTGPEA